MTKFEVNIPRTVKRVKIIHAKDIISETKDGFYPVLNSNDENYEDYYNLHSNELDGLNIDDDLLKSLFEEFDIPSDAKVNADNAKIKNEPIPKVSFFSEEFTISNINKPVQFDLSKINQRNNFIEEIHKEIQKAYDSGFTDGQDITRSTLESEINKQQEWLRYFDSVIQDLRIQLTLEFGKLEQTISELAIIIAEYILEHEISLNSKLFIEQARKAISTLDNEIVLKIHLHPENVEVLKKVKSTLFNDTTKMEGVVISANDTVDRGGCIIETNAGIIDARIRTQLDKIKQSLKVTILELEENIV
jgi:flagellar biosynthesis/type III secretory pathway protein FliH